MKIAIPVESDHLSLYFGQCSHYEIFGVKSGEIISTEIVQPSLHETDELPEWLISEGVSAVITCRIENDILNRLIENKLNVFIEAPLKTSSGSYWKIFWKGDCFREKIRVVNSRSSKKN